MAFTDVEIAKHMKVIEDLFWSRRRPPLHLREQVREGQRFEGYSIELFFVRPVFQRPGEFVEESIARIRYVRARSAWRLFWKRSDGKWHGYPFCPKTKTLAEALQVIDEDAKGCFLG